MIKWRFVNLGNMFLILIPCLTFDVAFCQLPDTSIDSSVVFKNIGIKLCQNKCIESGFCRSLEYTIPTLTCQLTEMDHDTITNEAQHFVGAKHLANVRAGPCQLKTCANMRCLETRTGKTECVKDKRNQAEVYTALNTTLFDACIIGDLVQVGNILFDGRQNINSLGKDNMTPVMHAAKEGHREVFDLLVREGANLSLLDDGDMNILHFTCVGGNVETVKYVLAQKIWDIDTRDFYGRTPIMHAANGGHKNVFDVLVEAGADLSPVTKNNETILHLGCYGGNKDIVKYLLICDTVGIDKQDRKGWTPVMHAARAGHKDVFDVLVDNGADLSLVDRLKETILHVACKGGNVEIIKYILTHEIVDIDNRDINGWTPVMHGVDNGHKHVFDVLVEGGADLSLLGDDKENILHVACDEGNVEIIKYLLTHEIADINNRDNEGLTPVMLAANNGQKNVFDVLVEAGADLSHVSHDKETILHMSCKGENVEIVKYLLAHANVDINSRDENGWTPVMIAAVKEIDEVFHVLVKEGADLSLLDDDNNSILHLACKHDSVQIVKYLLQLNIVNINSRNGNDRTSAMIAAREGHEAIFFFLVGAGADLTVINDIGDNILNLACEGENLQIVKYVSTRHIVEGPYREDNPC